MKSNRSFVHPLNWTLTTLSRPGLALVMSLILMVPWGWLSQASAQIPLVVLRISPANRATGVSINTTVTATFSLPLIAATVNAETFQVLEFGQVPIAGVITAIGPQAIFSPTEPLTINTRYVIRIVGGPNGVRGSVGVGAEGVPLADDFISSFTTGAGSTGQGTPIPAETGGTATDPRTGAATEIPPHTLKEDVTVNVITLDDTGRMTPIDPSCGVPIQPDEALLEVEGAIRVTEVVRYEVQPCGAIAFGPSMKLTLPLRRLLYPTGLPIGTTFRLFELGRSGGELVFRDTGIAARVTKIKGRRSPPGLSSFVTALDIPVFGTFAAFLVTGSAKPVTPTKGQQTQQAGGERLYFPIIKQTSGQQTRISLANPDPLAALDVKFTAYTESGANMGSQLQTVAANRQASFLVSDLFPGLTSGAIIAERQNGGAMTGFYEMADSFVGPATLGGAVGVPTPQSALAFPIVKSAGDVLTEVHVFNPNESPVTIKLAGFTALGNRVDATDSNGQPLDSIMLPPLGKLVISSAEPTTGNVRLDFAGLDGGYVLVQTTDGQAVTGGEFIGEVIGGQMSLALLNGLPFPSGCLASETADCVCQVDPSSESPVPSALRQYTLYATHFESNPAEQILYLVNVSDSPAEVALSAFSELGQFRAAFPPTGFLTLAPHQVFQASAVTLFGFNPSPGYVRVEDQNSAVVGGLINRNSVSGQFETVVPLIPDDPQLTQIPTNAFFSRIQLDPPSASPRMTTGMLIFNPNNNPVQFRIKITDASGKVRQSAVQSVAARGMFTRVQQSLNVLFPNVTASSGFAQVLVTTAPGPGLGGRLVPTAAYRSGPVVSTVPSQDYSYQ